MKIVIDIPEDDYNGLQRKDKFNDMFLSYYEKLIVYGTPLPKENKCKWINYDYRTVCPKEHDIDNPYWRIPESRMDVLKFCPYCGKEIELEADTGEEE